MIFEFTDRTVTKTGTFYRHYIGNSDDTKLTTIIEAVDEVERLKGTEITIGGKSAKILDSRIRRYCNLVNHNYYVEILTDEEFVIDPQI